MLINVAGKGASLEFFHLAPVHIIQTSNFFNI